MERNKKGHISVSTDLVAKILAHGDKEALSLLVLSIQVKLSSNSGNSVIRGRSMKDLSHKLKMGRQTFDKLREGAQFNDYFRLFVRKNGNVYLVAKNIKYNGQQYTFATEGAAIKEGTIANFIPEGGTADRKKIKKEIFKAVLYKASLRNHWTHNSLENSTSPQNGGNPARGSLLGRRKRGELLGYLASGVFLGLSYQRIAGIMGISIPSAVALIKEMLSEGTITKEKRQFDLGRCPDGDFRDAGRLSKLLEEKAKSLPGAHVGVTKWGGRIIATLSNVYMPTTTTGKYKWKKKQKHGDIPRTQKYYSLVNPVVRENAIPADILWNGEVRRDTKNLTPWTTMGFPLGYSGRPAKPQGKAAGTPTPQAKPQGKAGDAPAPRKARKPYMGGWNTERLKQTLKRFSPSWKSKNAAAWDAKAYEDALDKKAAAFYGLRNVDDLTMEDRDCFLVDLMAKTGRAFAQLDYYLETGLVPTLATPLPRRVEANMKGETCKALIRGLAYVERWTTAAYLKKLKQEIQELGENRALCRISMGTSSSYQDYLKRREAAWKKLQGTKVFKDKEATYGDFPFFKDLETIAMKLRYDKYDRELKEKAGGAGWEKMPYPTSIDDDLDKLWTLSSLAKYYKGNPIKEQKPQISFESIPFFNIESPVQEMDDEGEDEIYFPEESCNHDSFSIEYYKEEEPEYLYMEEGDEEERTYWGEELEYEEEAGLFCESF